MAATPARRTPMRVAQAWITLHSEDPEAVSAFAVARSRLAAGDEILIHSRLRLIELRGALPTRPRLERLLHGSIQFYNPHKERCELRTTAREAGPAMAGAHVVIVTERGGDRRAAAERWWLHETGACIEVREGTAWRIEIAPDSKLVLDDLITVRDRCHGLLCHPRSQEARVASGRIPLPWISPLLDAANVPVRSNPEGSFA